MDNISIVLAHANNVINTANSYISYGTFIIAFLALGVAIFGIYVTLAAKRSKQEIVNQTIKEILRKLQYDDKFKHEIFTEIMRNDEFVKKITISIITDKEIHMIIDSTVTRCFQDHIPIIKSSEDTTLEEKDILENVKDNTKDFECVSKEPGGIENINLESSKNDIMSNENINEEAKDGIAKMGK